MDDEVEKIAAQIPVSGVLPQDVMRSRSEFNSFNDYFEWFVQDFPEYPRCDAWVRELVNRLVENCVLSEDVKEIMATIPRQVDTVNNFIAG